MNESASLKKQLSVLHVAESENGANSWVRREFAHHLFTLAMKTTENPSGSQGKQSTHVRLAHESLNMDYTRWSRRFNEAH